MTDGANDDKAAAKRALIAASRLPIFFQFVGIGGGTFDFLQRLDDLSGRVVDNANFFDLSEPKKMSADRLYELMMAEYPTWLAEARAKKIIR